jgi:hypothetical protein
VFVAHNPSTRGAPGLGRRHNTERDGPGGDRSLLSRAATARHKSNARRRHLYSKMSAASAVAPDNKLGRRLLDVISRLRSGQALYSVIHRRTARREAVPARASLNAASHIAPVSL